MFINLNLNSHIWPLSNTLLNRPIISSPIMMEIQCVPPKKVLFLEGFLGFFFWFLWVGVVVSLFGWDWQNSIFGRNAGT